MYKFLTNSYSKVLYRFKSNQVKLKDFFFILVWMLSFFCAGTSYSMDTLIASGHPDFPPSMWRENDKIIGVGAEIARMVFTDLGIETEVKYTGNWQRVQRNAQEGQIDVIIAAYRTESREKYLNYFSIPLMYNSSHVWVWKGKGFSFNSWNDLVGKTGVAVIGASFGMKFDTIIAKHLDIRRVANHIQCFKLLKSGRVDYFPFGLYPGTIQSKRFGYADYVEFLPEPINRVPLYLSISKKSKFKKYLPEAEKRLKKYLEDGTVKKLIEKYIGYYTKSEMKESE